MDSTNLKSKSQRGQKCKDTSDNNAKINKKGDFEKLALKPSPAALHPTSLNCAVNPLPNMVHPVTT